MGKVVPDHPFAPSDLQPIGILPEAGKEISGVLWRGGRGIEYLPFVSWKIDFHPAVRVAGANDVVAAQVVVLARQEAVHLARGNAQCSQHDGHRGSEILAMSGARFK